MEVAVNTDCVTTTFLVDEESQIRATAKSLRENILNKYNELQDLNWPQTSEELQEYSQTPPKSVCIFLERLIKYDDHNITEKQARLISSVTQDIVFAVSRRKVMQRKHLLVALGRHSFTGSRKIIDIVHKLGHCISYNLMSDTEGAQANCFFRSSKKVEILPVNLSSKNDVVRPFFWADNYNTIVERVGGGASVTVTHLVAFREITPNNIVKTRDSTVPRRKTRGFFYEDINIDYKPVHKTEKPEKLFVKICFHRLWSYFRKLKGFEITK